MASLSPESRNTVKFQKYYFMNGNYCSGIYIFKFIVSKSQVDNQSTVTLVLEKLMTGIPDHMASSVNNISNFNKEIRSVGTDIRES